MEQTAVEFLVEKLNQFNGEDNPWFDIPLSLLEQAKQMERQQIVDAFYEGMQANTFDQNKGRALMYYSETYIK